LVWLGDQFARWVIWPGRKADGSLPIGNARSFKILPLVWRRPLFSFLVLGVSFLLVYNLAFYLPFRFQELRGLYGVSRACYRPFETAAARSLTPALVAVIVAGKWIEYGCMIDMSSPFMDSDYVFIVSAGYVMDSAVAETLPGRRLLYYDPVNQKLMESIRGGPARE
jgi:hypothetical protein